MSNNRIIIIGGNSFIGNFLFNYLQKYYEVICISRNSRGKDLSIDVDFYHNFDDYLILNNDIVINCVYIPDNLLANTTIYDKIYLYLKSGKIYKYIHISTACVVGISDDDNITELTPCNPITKYEIEKYRIEEYIRKSSDGLDITIVRPTAVFGQGGQNLKKFVKLEKTGSRINNYVRAFLYGYRKMHLLPHDLFSFHIFKIVNSCFKPFFRIHLISLDDDVDNNYRSIISIIRNEYGRKYIPQIYLPIIFTKLILKFFGKNTYEVSRYYRGTNPNPSHINIRNTVVDYIRSLNNE